MSKPRVPRNVIILAFVAFASGFGQDLVASVLPAYLVLIGMSRADIGLIDGLLQGTTNVFRILSGWVSDRTHRRKQFVFLGYILSSVARPLLAFTSAFLPIAALRVIDGSGKGIKDAPRDALVADATASGAHGRAFGFHRMIDTAGSVFGPMTAFFLLLALAPSLGTYRFIFALASIPGAVAFGLIWFGVRERTPQTAHKKTGGSLPPVFWIFTVGMTLALLTKINDSLFLVRAQDLGIAKAYIPLLFGAFTLIYAACSYPIGIWSDRIGKMPLLVSGWILLALVEFGFSFDPSVPTALILFAGYGLFFALTEGSARAFIADAVSEERRGSAYGIYNACTGIALIAGGYLLGRVWDAGAPELAFRISAAGSLIGGLILLLLRTSSRSAGYSSAR